jgi:outer membrane protein insertion porin family
LLRTRAALLASAFAASLFAPDLMAQSAPAGPPAPNASAPAPAPAPVPAPARRGPVARVAPAPATGDVIQAIQVEGNSRIEEGTILSYMLVTPGDRFSSERIDRSLRTLYATGLFADVAIRRQGNALVVRVVENPIVNQIIFEGNHNIKDDDLRKDIELRPRAVYTARAAQSDRLKMLNAYAQGGRYATTIEPQIVRLPQNRVNVVFHIVEGPETDIARIVFVGNHDFGEGQLRAVISSRQSVWWNFFTSADQFNPDRINYDRELLRRFYLEHGYVDVEITGTRAELSPDRKSFFITYTINEGGRYRLRKVDVVSEIPKVNAADYRDLESQHAGQWYDGRVIERDVDAMEARLRQRGFPFARVEPRVARNRAKHQVDLVYEIMQGPRQYVERIEITGNSRTRDKVIRREFRFAEGDPFNAEEMRRTKQRLTDLGYFGDVKVTQSPGSQPDRVIVNTDVTEKATGEISLGGGYSTDAGILGQAGLRERNVIGSGIDGGISGTLAERESQVDISITDPYFLDRNLVTGADVYYLNNNNLYISDYEEKRIGMTLRLGYAFNSHVSQAWTYSIVDRDVYNIQPTASIYIAEEAGYSLLSALGQTLAFDWRDSRLNPHKGFIVRAGTDFAGIGGDEHYVRAKVDGSYYYPLDRFTGNSDWTLELSAGVGHLWNLQSRERIIDRFFLGGDNLRGFQDGGAGPHSVPYFIGATQQYFGSDSLGGRTIYTQSTELHFPLPLPADLGVSGRAFVDVGGLTGLNVPPIAQNACKPYTNIRPCFTDDATPRVGAGIGVDWNSPFGLINVSIAAPVVKKSYDQTQVFRFGFGTRF